MAQRGRPPTLAGFVKSSQHWTPDQLAWLRAKGDATGIVTVAAVARMIVQAAMDAERAQQAEAV